jgi:hypothetical protein
MSDIVTETAIIGGGQAGVPLAGASAEADLDASFTGSHAPKLIRGHAARRGGEKRLALGWREQRLIGCRMGGGQESPALEPGRADRVNLTCQLTSAGNSYGESASRVWRSRSRGGLSLIGLATGPMMRSAMKPRACYVSTVANGINVRTGRASRRRWLGTRRKWRITSSAPPSIRGQTGNLCEGDHNGRRIEELSCRRAGDGRI